MLCLGSANILYGRSKIDEYISVLSNSASTIPSLEDTQSPMPVLGRYIQVDQQVDQLNRVKSRIDFYELIIVGGKAFLAISGICFLAFLFLLRKDGFPQLNPKES